MKLHSLAVARALAMIIATMMICLPVRGQCMPSSSNHSDSTTGAPYHESTSDMTHVHADHSMEDKPATNSAGAVESKCCDTFTCDMPSCAPVAGGHIAAIALPELLKSAGIFARASTDAPNPRPQTLFKPPIYA